MKTAYQQMQDRARAKTGPAKRKILTCPRCGQSGDYTDIHPGAILLQTVKCLDCGFEALGENYKF